MTYEETMRSVRREMEDIREHRPKTLSIAVNGKITAFHDVQGAQSTLSSRIESPEGAQFIEVFAEQRIRLALLPIGERPPVGSDVQTQHIRLCDDRWLELRLRFDGVGLESEVTYFDPVLAQSFTAADQDEIEDSAWAESETAPLPTLPVPLSWRTRVLQFVQAPMISRGFAWTVGLILALGVGGLLTYRLVRPLDADQLLSRSVAMETSSLEGNAEHETMRIEVRAADGQVRQQGIIDLWKEGTAGRLMRKLYNAQHVLLAAEWRNQNGIVASYAVPGSAQTSDADRELMRGGFWRTELSASAYRADGGKQLQARRVGENYELTSKNALAGHDAVAESVLVLDREFHPISETLRLRGEDGNHEVHLVRTGYEVRSAHSVPDSVYSPEEFEPVGSSAPGTGSLVGGSPLLPQASAMRAAVLQIAALYELNRLAADTGEPISITRTEDDHILVSGTVADSRRREEIRSSLESLPDHQLLNVHLASQGNSYGAGAARERKTMHGMTVYDFAGSSAPADPVLNRHFAQRRLNGDQVKEAMAQFSRDALGHAQRALQHAYALQRLGASFTPIELQTAPVESQHMWAAMAARHAAALDSELEALNTQLAALGAPGASAPASGEGRRRIHHPSEFARAANLLLSQVQAMNTKMGNAFTSTVSGSKTEDSAKFIADALQSIPLTTTRQMATFTSELAKQDEASPAPGGAQSK